MGESQTFGQWLRHHRREMDLTQVELSQRVGCAPVTIRKVEADEMRPSKQLAELLVEQLGVPVEERENFIRFARGGEMVVPVVAAVRRHNLPHSVSSFIGREREIAEVKRLISSSRLMTLTGVGGGGKTRLALQVARDLVDTFKDGVWWVELAALTDSSLVPQTIAKVFSLREEPNQETSEVLANFLHSKQLLLVIDNCEHLISECARLIESFLHRCANLRILATSREPLAISGETVFQVTPLSLPELNETSLKRFMQSEAARLFVERAAAATPGFKLSKQNVAAVARICQTLDGIPLAIELAAARVKMLTEEHIAEWLDKRFDLLTTGSRTAMPRQQTLRAAIDWSYELLSEKEKTLFRHLSEFAGGFRREAAEAVCSNESLPAGTVFTVLSRLVDRSLVEVMQTGEDERYRMLETIRLYAREKLQGSGEEDRLRDCHLKYFTVWAEEVEPKLRGPEQITWWDRMEIEHNNIRSALEWSLAGGDVQLGLRLAGAAYWFWQPRANWTEGLKWLKELLAREVSLPLTPARAKVLAEAGWLAWNMSTLDPADDWIKESLEFWQKTGDDWWTAYVLVFFGWRLLYQCNTSYARATFEEAVGFARASEDEWILGLSLKSLGAAVERFDYSAARLILEESIAIWRIVGAKAGLADVINQLGTIAHGQNDNEKAATLYEESLRLYREMGSKSDIAMVLFNLGSIRIIQGKYIMASRLFLEGMTLAYESGDKHNTATNLAGLGGVAGSQGQQKRAVRLLGAAEAWRKSISEDLSAWPYVLVDFDNWNAIARAQLDEADYAVAYEEGKAMSLEQAVRYALEGSGGYG